MQRERCMEDVDGKVFVELPEDYVRIHHGTVVVQDGSSKEIVLVVQFTPFAEITTDDYKEFNELCTKLVDLKPGASRIHCNKALRTGQMHALDWRKGL